jgi:hypothetical protein
MLKASHTQVDVVDVAVAAFSMQADMNCKLLSPSSGLVSVCNTEPRPLTWCGAASQHQWRLTGQLSSRARGIYTPMQVERIVAPGTCDYLYRQNVVDLRHQAHCY